MDSRSCTWVGVPLLLLLGVSSAYAQSGDDLAPPPPPASAPGAADAPPGDLVEEGPPTGSAPTAPQGYGQPAPVPGPPRYAQPGPPYAPPGQPQPYAQPSQPQYVAPGAPPQYSRRMRIRYQEGMQVPAGAEIIERRKTGLWVTGLAVFGASYVLSALVASVDADLALFAVPVLGPVIWQVRDGDRNTTSLTVVDTLAQTAGLVLFALGMRKSSYLEYWATTLGGRRLAVIPRISRDQVGLTLTVL